MKENKEVDLRAYFKKAIESLNKTSKDQFIDSFCLFYTIKDEKNEFHNYISLGSEDILQLVYELGTAIQEVVKAKSYKEIGNGLLEIDSEDKEIKSEDAFLEDFLKNLKDQSNKRLH